MARTTLPLLFLFIFSLFSLSLATPDLDASEGRLHRLSRRRPSPELMERQPQAVSAVGTSNPAPGATNQFDGNTAFASDGNGNIVNFVGAGAKKRSSPDLEERSFDEEAPRLVRREPHPDELNLISSQVATRGLGNGVIEVIG